MQEFDENWFKYFNHGCLRWDLESLLKEKNIKNMENNIVFVMQTKNKVRALVLSIQNDTIEKPLIDSIRRHSYFKMRLWNSSDSDNIDFFKSYQSKLIAVFYFFSYVSYRRHEIQIKKHQR